jgi:hypothetical protein
MGGFKVGPSYRTNKLSSFPGGVIVIVEHRDGRRFVYDKIKYPQKYIKIVKKNPLVKDAWIKQF